jgi:hypothetical protein
MNLASIKSHLCDKTSIIGISGIVATAAGLVAHAMTHDITWSAAAFGILGSTMAVILPENKAAQSSIEKFVSDTVTAAAQKRLAAMLPTLIQDGMAVATALTPPAPVVVQTAAPVSVTTTTTTQPAV